jgi:hypothetical protein
VYSPLDLSGKMRYPHGIFPYSSQGPCMFSMSADALPVAKWVKTQYGPRSPLVAVFMTHAVINGNGGVSFHIVNLFLMFLRLPQILHYYLDMGLGVNANMAAVPVTLKHFQLLARLGRSPVCSQFCHFCRI